MDEFWQAYRIYEHVVGILVLLFLALYLVHCTAVGDLVGLGQFGDYIKVLVRDLFK
jgi:hypothetical protein